MKKKLPKAYRCCEGTGYFAENCTKEEAWKLVLEEMHDWKDDNFSHTIDELTEVMMRKCLDCGSYWVDSDDGCGECGESRLSKRFHYAWYLVC